MLTLLTGNPRKYEPLAELLDRLEIRAQAPDFELPELQHADFPTVLKHKARRAAEAFGKPCLVDDSGLVLDAYPGFPGPMTRQVCHLLGAAGLERLLAGVTSRGRMVCHLGCLIDGELWQWQGEVAGRLDPSRSAASGAMPLTQWFVPDEDGPSAVFAHRRRALEALGRDLAELRRAFSGQPACGAGEAVPASASCVFCAEFAGSAASVYREILGAEAPSRILHSTKHFVVFPPLGEFVEGGLLLATREHIPSMADLPESYYGELESLMEETARLLAAHYGCPPLFFEHAPAAPGEKGTCCVDHAHLNVFPVRADVHAHLERFPHAALGRMAELKNGRQAYLFLQANDGRRFVYHAGIVPSQYVRRIVTAELGMPQRWHWREYLGLEELKRTQAALAGWRCPDGQTP
jgi:XTP/dITP diphosphohydrolase